MHGVDECMGKQREEYVLKTDVKLNTSYCGVIGSKDVLDFIENFLNHLKNPEAEAMLKNQFSAGYCYYFAVILKAAFSRGEVCWCAPYGHICWVDEDNIPYDIYGICTSEAEYFIPVSFLGDAVNDFLHTDKVYNAAEEDIQKMIADYLKEKSEQKR